jgi:uncharacterized protein YjiK
MRNAGRIRVAKGRRTGLAGRSFLIGVALVSMAGFLPIVALSQSASASIVPSSTPVTSVNLADYGLVARYPLPSKANPLGGDTSCTSGSGDVLADEASAVAYDPNGNGGTGSLFVLGDGGACVVQTTLTGTYIDSMTLASGNSAQGTAFYDTEGITYVGQDGGKPQLVMTEERYRQLDEFDYTAGTTLTLAEAQAVKLGTTIGNIGLEGVAYDPATSNAAGCSSRTVGAETGNFCQGFVVVKEKQPEDIFQTNVDWGSRGAQSTDPATGTATNGGPQENEGTANAPTPLFPPANAGLNDFSDAFAMSNIGSLSGTDTVTGADGTPYDGDLLIDSQESGSIELVNRSGAIKSRLDLLPNPSSGLNVVDETHEGVAMDQFGNLYVDSEDGAGPNAPELEVYAPTTDPDKSPTAITLASTKGTLPSTTTTANGPVKLSDLTVTDGDSDGIGTDVYSVTATDGGAHDVSSLFKADHTGLYLASGASLATVPSPVTITVTVKDPNAVDASSFPNGVTSSPFTLTVNSVTQVAGSEGKIIISEVDPSGSGSGNNSYGEDWFELTDTGTQPVDLAGWSADDSHEVAGKNPLFGVSTIDPGESVVFVQADTAVGATTTPADTVAAFRSDWGLSSNVQVGWYSDADGLSQSGDEVNVYDAGENFVTGVSFGASENKVSFDNSAGITGAIDTFSDSGGDDGSFTDAEGETGSPGFAHIAPTVAVTEVDPAGSSAAYGADWFELTNYGTHAVDLTGWTMDDNSAALANSVSMTVGSASPSLAPGQSIVFAEDPADSSVSSGSEPIATLNADLPGLKTAFQNAWFPGGVAPSGFQFGIYGGKSVGLSTSSDGVTIFDGNGSVVDEVQFSGSGIFENPGLVGVGGSATEAAAPALTTVAVAGVAGARTDTAGETGSPGEYVPTLSITEVDPTGNNMSYAADWFEVTNTGTNAVDLTGWKMDDSSDALATAVSMTVGTGSPILGAGQSIVFAEDPADSTVSSGSESVAILNADLPGLQSAFDTAWFPGGTAPSSFQFGIYGGKGVGLSTSSDAVNLFNGSGNQVTGVTFGAASTTSPIATFDNTAGGSSVSTLSQVGVHGAFTSANGAEVGSPGTIVTTTPPPPPTPSVAITEVDPTGSGQSYAADWFELTNTGTSAVDLTGWKMDDSSDAIATAVPLGGVSSLPVGKSAVFFEDTNGTDATIQAAFSTAWFGTSTLPSGFLIGHYGGSGVGLSSSGDAVNLFDASGNPVTGVTFGAASTTSPMATFDNTAGGSSVSTLSQVGVHGGFVSANGAEIGSPGTIVTPPPPPPSVAITEVDPTGSSQSYAADWFELTNTGTSTVDLTGWKMDDSSDAIATAVPLGGVSSIPAGKSAVFFEDTNGTDATIQAAFSAAWFGTSTLPSGFLIGHYGGSGVGLSSSGDAVNLFDASGNPVTGVTFGAASTTAPMATFDNTAGGSSVSTLSQVGVHGGFTSANGAEIGSPGTIAGVVPGAPTAVTASPGDRQATVGWMAPVQNGGSSIIGYTVTASPGGETCQTTGALTCAVTGLANGTATTFSVTATNAVGTGDASVASDPVTPSTVPDAPTDVSAAPGNTKATVSFGAPFDEGSAITGYKVSTTDLTHPAHGGETASGTASPITVTGLTNGDSYTFAVVATNGDGSGPASAPSASVTPSNLVPLAIVAPPSIGVGAGKVLHQVITATGNPPATITASNLPSWLTVKNGKAGKAATLTGKAPATGGGGSFTITVAAANGIEAQAEQNITINVLAFTSADAANFTIGQSGSFTVRTSDTPANPTLAAQRLPAGLTFTDHGDGTATISGAPTTKNAKTVKVNLTATSGGAVVKQVLTVSMTH